MTSTVIFRDRSPRATAVVTPAIFRTCAGQVRRHRVDRVGQILPGARDAGHDGLAAQLAFRPDFARDSRDLGGKASQLIDHRIDGFLQLQDLAANVNRDLLGQVAVRHGDRHVRDVADLRGQVAGHLVDRFGELFPDAGYPFDLRLAAEFSFGAYLARHTRDFGREHRQLVDHLVDQFCGTEKLPLELPAVHLQRHRLTEVAFGDRADRARHFGRRPDQVIDQRVDCGDFVGPAPANARAGSCVA